MKKYSYKKNGFWKYKDCFVTDSFDSFEEAARDLHLKKRRAILVAEKPYSSFYMDSIQKMLSSVFSSFMILEFEKGKSKVSDDLKRLSDAFQAMHLTGEDCIVSLGGSFADLLSKVSAGRHLPDAAYIQIPLTFTAQLLSTGGPEAEIENDPVRFADDVEADIQKPLKQPDLIFINLLSYKNLTDDERISGMGEVIRASVSEDPELLTYLENNTGKKTDDFTEFLLNLVMNCLRINDSSGSLKEEGGRYGYTIARALERCTNYIIPHGSAAGIGIVVAGGISEHRGLLKNEDHFRVAKLMVTYGLPVSMNFTNELIDAITASVRAVPGLVSEDGTLREFVLLEKPGKTITVNDVRMDEILDVMNYRRFSK